MGSKRGSDPRGQHGSFLRGGSGARDCRPRRVAAPATKEGGRPPSFRAGMGLSCGQAPVGWTGSKRGSDPRGQHGFFLRGWSGTNDCRSWRGADPRFEESAQIIAWLTVASRGSAADDATVGPPGS
eukprot:13653472-Alexandrium_andersonii.AAC.1